jgi:hypothetical protein
MIITVGIRRALLAHAAQTEARMILTGRAIWQRLARAEPAMTHVLSCTGIVVITQQIVWLIRVLTSRWMAGFADSANSAALIVLIANDVGTEPKTLCLAV